MDCICIQKGYTCIFGLEEFKCNFNKNENCDKCEVKAKERFDKFFELMK